MKEKLIQRLGTFLSAAAVAVSLVFVGLEVRNNTIAARGASLQAISDSMFSGFLQISLDKEMAELMVRVFDGETSESFSDVENQQIVSNLLAYLTVLQNSYLQYREGLLPETVFESYGWRDNITRTPYFREFWTSVSPTAVSLEFREFFECEVLSRPVWGQTTGASSQADRPECPR